MRPRPPPTRIIRPRENPRRVQPPADRPGRVGGRARGAVDGAFRQPRGLQPRVPGHAAGGDPGQRQVQRDAARGLNDVLEQEWGHCLAGDASLLGSIKCDSKNTIVLHALPCLMSRNWVGNHNATLLASCGHNQSNLGGIVSLVFQGEVRFTKPEAREDLGAVTNHWNAQSF